MAPYYLYFARMTANHLCRDPPGKGARYGIRKIDLFAQSMEMDAATD